MNAGLPYLLCATSLLVHEVDAVRCREWRLLYVLRTMDEDRARKAFILLHWPLSLLILAPFVLRGAGAAWLATGIAVFAVVHLVLHLRLKDDPANEFSGA
ncbi:MAG: DUF6713 family protein, partial [Pseudomonadota bacterium]